MKRGESKVKNDMQKRMSISINKEMDQKIIALKKTDQYCRCSYAEIIRQLIKAGIEVIEADKKGAWLWIVVRSILGMQIKKEEKNGK